MNSKVHLRSQEWFGRKDKLGTIYRNPIRAEGFSPKVFENKPVIGICNSWSELAVAMCICVRWLKRSNVVCGQRVGENSVLVLKNAGPVGAPGMPEVGSLPIPAKLLKRGVTDMLRLSDARMSGTSYGTVVLHVAPESAIGGPLPIVQDGDVIELNVSKRQLNVRLSQEDMGRRLSVWQRPVPHYDRGYGQLYIERILQANQGCDFDFLRWVSPGRKLEGSERSKARRAADKLPVGF